MAVTLTIADLSAALRLGNSAEELKEVTRLHAFASEAVDRYAPDAPENTANEAVVRLAAQLFDQPTASRGGYANALRISGAARILMPYRIHRAGSTADAIAIAQGAVGTPGNPVIGVAVSGEELIVTFADGTTDQQTLPAVGVGVGSGTADLLVERLGTLDNPTLPDDRRWLGTGVLIPDGVHVLMIDAGQASDDYHLVDWDAILMHTSVVAGEISMAGEFETFKGDAFTDLRIGHGADYEVLVANDSTQSINLAHIHFERLLAPIGPGGGGMFNGVDQDARDAAEAAQTEIDDHESNHPSSYTNAQAQDAARSVVSDWAEQDNGSDIPESKTQRKIFLTTSPINGNTDPGTRSKLHDVHLYVEDTEWQVYEHTGTAPPYLVLRSRLTETAVAVQALINTHAATPNVHHAGPSLLGSYTGTLSNTAWTATSLTPTAGKAMVGVVYVGANTHNSFTWNGWSMSWYPRNRYDATNAADGAWRYNFRSSGSQLIYVGRAGDGSIQVRVNGVQTETFEFEFWEL